MRDMPHATTTLALYRLPLFSFEQQVAARALARPPTGQISNLFLQPKKNPYDFRVGEKVFLKQTASKFAMGNKEREIMGLCLFFLSRLPLQV